MGSKSDLNSQYLYSSLLFAIFSIQLIPVLSEPVPLRRIDLSPNQPVLARSLNTSLIVVCYPSPPEMTVKWLSPGRKVVRHEDRIYTQPEGNGALSLVFEQIRFADEGDWSCVSEQEDDSVRSHFKLNVIQDIVFADTANVQAATEGQDAFIRCEATGDPLPKIWWFFKGKDLPESSKKYKQTADGLYIYKVEKADAGEYDCRAYQNSEVVSNIKWRIIRFNVFHAPFFVDDRTVFYGYDLGIANLSCNVMADPPASISWSAANPKVPQKCFTVHNDTNSSELEVFLGDKRVYGKYTCRAKNSLGSIEKTVELRMGTKPDPPKWFAVKGVNNQSVHIQLGFEPEFGDYDEATFDNLTAAIESEIVTGYSFEVVKLDNYNRYMNPWAVTTKILQDVDPTRNYILEDLEPATKYKVRVATVTLAGRGDYTKARDFATSANALSAVANLSLMIMVIVLAVRQGAII